MADCAIYEAEYQALLSEVNQVNGQWITVKSSGVNAARNLNIAGAESAKAQLRGFLTKVSTLIDKTGKASYKASLAKCTASEDKLDNLQDTAVELRDNIETGIFEIDEAISDAEDQIRESEEATTTQDNAGNGAPGSAAGNSLTDEDEDLIIDDEPLPEDEFEDEFGEGLEEPPDITDDELGIDPEKELEQLEKEAALNAAEAESLASNTNRGLSGAVDSARQQATLQDTRNFEQKEDWRVRLSLAPGAFYLYKDESNELLAPLRKTDGIIFPYTPTINVTYGANYQSVAPVHSNYKIFQYENSYVDSVNITCDFTAQDTEEAKYLLAVIHFLRSVTKMFYGQDFNPKPGTPPPLVYLFGLGEFQFNAHPLAITNFTYNLPADVDYIRAGAVTEPAGVSRSGASDIAKPSTTSLGTLVQNAVQDRLNQGVAAIGNALGLNLNPGGTSRGYTFGASNRFNSPAPPGTIEPTYVPTKISISVSAIPIVSRYEISSEFSLENYANGTLLRGTKRPGGGIW